MHKDFWGWSLESVGKAKVDTKYVLEYIDDPKIADKLEQTGDYELFTKREFDDISKAITAYMTRYMKEDCVIVHLWETVLINGEMVLEQMIEPTGDFKHCMRHAVDDEMRHRVASAERRAEDLERSNDLYAGFIKAMGKQFENMFNEFCKRETEG